MITKRQGWCQNSFTEDKFDYDENSLITSNPISIKKKSYKKWTKEEDERLREYILSHDGLKDWSQISKYVNNGRTDAQCQHRWERFLDPSITKGAWTDEEDKKMIELVRDYGARQWSLIAKELKGRIGKQCRERWHNHLNPSINKNPWTNEENLRLFILHQHFGNKWAEIAKYFNGRSDNSIKNHWNSSMKKKFHLEVENLNKQGLDWTALIPSDFSWPKLDQPISDKTPCSSRIPLRTLTNRPLSSDSSNLRNTSIENSTSILNSNIHPYNSNVTSTIYSDPLQCIPSCEDIDYLLFGSHSSPNKSFHDYLSHSPERANLICLTPSPGRDCFNEYLLPLSDSINTENYSTINLDKYDLSINHQYNPTYIEILTGQTRDQRFMTEQARRYLSCSALNYS